MANIPGRGEPHSKPSAQRQGKSTPDNDSLANDDRGTRPYQTQEQNQAQQQEQRRKHGRGADRGGNEDEPGRNDVEVGDPVPEDDRTVRVRGGGSGETGEDEDLPDDTGDIEGSSERH